MKLEWSLKSIDEIAKVERGRSKHRPRNDPSLYNGLYPFVQTTSIHNSDLYITSYSKTYNEQGLAQSRLWEPGVICITNAGENTGDCAILGIRACLPDSIIAVSPIPGKADLIYLKYAIDSLKSQLRKVTRGATQDNLSIAKLTSFKFTVPPFKTQQKIGEILRIYGDLIENNRRRIELLEESARLLYREWFVYLRFPGHEHTPIIDGIPEGWERKSLFDIAEATYGFAFKSSLFNEEGEGLPVVRIRDIPPGSSKTFTTEEATEDKLLQDGDFLIGMDGDFHMNYWVGGKAWINQRVVRISSKLGYTNGFLRCALDKPIKYFNSTIVGTTVSHLGAKNISSITLIIPPKSLLEAINQPLDNIRIQIVALQKQSQSAAYARDILIPRLMNGEIAV